LTAFTAHTDSNEKTDESPRWFREHNVYKKHSAPQNDPPICRIAKAVNNVLQLNS